MEILQFKKITDKAQTGFLPSISLNISRKDFGSRYNGLTEKLPQPLGDYGCTGFLPSISLNISRKDFGQRYNGLTEKLPQPLGNYGRTSFLPSLSANRTTLPIALYNVFPKNQKAHVPLHPPSQSSNHTGCYNSQNNKVFVQRKDPYTVVSLISSQSSNKTIY